MKNRNRLKLLSFAVCAALLAGILLSFELWFPVYRTFPRAPLVFALPENAVSIVERLLAVVLIAALISTFIFRRLKISAAVAALASLAALIFFDQTRLQPWVYQYLLLIVVLIAGGQETEDESISGQTLALAQAVVAGLYFWSGIQKLNFTFAHEIVSFLLAPLQSVFPDVESSYAVLGIGIALTEASIGVGLLVRQTRNAAVCAAAAMHAIILTILIVKNYNQIVWIWNIALVFIVFVSFWRSDVSVKQTFGKAANRKMKTARVIVFAAVLLPILSFWGCWDVYLSGALYSGNVPVAVVRVSGEVFEKLPPKARSVVFQTKTGGERMLPLVEWAIAEMNVPVYPERRVFEQAARGVCRLAEDENRVELIIKERPAIFDGNYSVTRIKCAELAP